MDSLSVSGSHLFCVFFLSILIVLCVSQWVRMLNQGGECLLKKKIKCNINIIQVIILLLWGSATFLKIVLELP